MRKIILTVCFLGLFGAAYAQAFKINENRASFGVGLGWRDKKINNSNTTHFPSPNAIVERSILPLEKVGFLSIGAQFGFHHGKHNNKTFNYEQSWTSIYFVPRVVWYFHDWFIEEADDFPSNIDLYAGIGIGFNFISHKRPENIDLEDNGGFNFGYHVFAGARYYFKPYASVFAELGYGLSFLNVGLTIRY
jgi:opacity protein-like surface antigen